jgi:hypothetical protein
MFGEGKKTPGRCGSSLCCVQPAFIPTIHAVSFADSKAVSRAKALLA